jgi:hypothetical protein
MTQNPHKHRPLLVYSKFREAETRDIPRLPKLYKLTSLNQLQITTHAYGLDIISQSQFHEVQYELVMYILGSFL